MNNLSRYIAIGFSLLLVGLVFYFFSNIVAFVLISWVLSMIGQPLMRFFQKKIKIGRFKAGPSISAVLTLLLYIIVSVTLIAVFVPPVVLQARNLAEVDYSAIYQALQVPITQLTSWLTDLNLVDANTVAPEEQLRESLKNWFEPTRIGNFFSSLIGVAGNLVFSLFSIVFITFFFLKEQGLFTSFVLAITPNKYVAEIEHGLESISNLLTRYFGGILIQITIITIFVSILLRLLGVENALLIGFFAAVIKMANMAPINGPK
ncbi:MAG: AI-2E family transporter [Bacteroidota bacterium]